MSETGPPKTKVIVENSISSQNYDGLIIVASPNHTVKIKEIAKLLEITAKYDAATGTETVVLPLPAFPASRLVYAPTGPIDVDYDDVRVFKKAAVKGVQRALKAGIKKPLLVLDEEDTHFANVGLAIVLGALEALYVPIQHREFNPSKSNLVEHLAVFGHNHEKTEALVNQAKILEEGRRVASDIGGADPERMTPLRIQAYIASVFANTTIKTTVYRDVAQIAKEFPLFEAVNRAASTVARHQGCVVFLEYEPPAAARTTLYLVGKGVTYDTGGADLKVNGAMTGMSQDKCGAAAAVGFMQLVRLLAPTDIRVVVGVGLVRNSIGANSYVADEIITARSGARIRVNNTDAEGRMVMADILCMLKEQALNAVNPHLFTVATLTGHACLAAGNGYSIVMDNGPARQAGNADHLQKAGDLIGDPFEISRIRRDDLAFHQGKTFDIDVEQCGSVEPSARTPRGHQGPAAFLLLASGLDKHGSGADRPLKYSHLDIAASAGKYPQPATGAPVLALAKAFLLN